MAPVTDNISQNISTSFTMGVLILQCYIVNINVHCYVRNWYKLEFCGARVQNAPVLVEENFTLYLFPPSYIFDLGLLYDTF